MSSRLMGVYAYACPTPEDYEKSTITTTSSGTEYYHVDEQEVNKLTLELLEDAANVAKYKYDVEKLTKKVDLLACENNMLRFSMEYWLSQFSEEQINGDFRLKALSNLILSLSVSKSELEDLG